MNTFIDMNEELLVTYTRIFTPRARCFHRHCQNQIQSVCAAFELLYTFCVIIRSHKNGNIYIPIPLTQLQALFFDLLLSLRLYLCHCFNSFCLITSIKPLLRYCLNYLNGCIRFLSVSLSLSASLRAILFVGHLLVQTVRQFNLAECTFIVNQI